MIKIIFALLLGTFSLIAADNNDKNLACGLSDYDFVVDKPRYIFVASSDAFPIIMADTQTIQIDRKNKTIQVWTIHLSTGKEEFKILKTSEYRNFGYFKKLTIVNYKTMKSKPLGAIAHNCSGSLLLNSDTAGEWGNISPNSVDELIVETLVKKYKLK